MTFEHHDAVMPSREFDRDLTAMRLNLLDVDPHQSCKLTGVGCQDSERAEGLDVFLSSPEGVDAIGVQYRWFPQ